MKLRNVSGQDLVVPGLARLVMAGQIVDVPDDVADTYTCQESTWQPVNQKEGD